MGDALKGKARQEEGMTNARSIFRRYKREDAKVSRETRVAEDGISLALMHIFNGMVRLFPNPFACTDQGNDSKWEWIDAELAKLDYSIEDAERVSMMLMDIDGHGPIKNRFYMELMLKGPDGTYTFHSNDGGKSMTEKLTEGDAITLRQK